MEDTIAQMTAASALSAKIAVVFALTVIFLEWLFLRFVRHASYRWREAAMSIVMGLGYAKAATLAGLVWGWLYLFFWEHRLVTLPLDHWGTWAALFVAIDFAYYWMHRYAHRTRLGWASHVQHHSPTEMNMSVTARLSVTAWLSGYQAFFAPLCLLGFHPVSIATMLLINIVWQAPLHTEVVRKLWRPIEYVFNTPSHHRAHHGKNARYLDGNYGAIFVLWDRLFGTFREERAEDPPDYGLVQPVTAASYPRLMVKLLTIGWIDLARAVVGARGWNARLQVAFRPPGWEPVPVRAAPDSPSPARWRHRHRAAGAGAVPPGRSPPP